MPDRQTQRRAAASAFAHQLTIERLFAAECERSGYAEACRKLGKKLEDAQRETEKLWYPVGR